MLTADAERAKAYKRLAAISPTLSRTEVNVLLALIRQATSPRWEVQLAQPQLCGISGCAQRSIRRSLPRLIKLGLITATRGTKSHPRIYGLTSALVDFQAVAGHADFKFDEGPAWALNEAFLSGKGQVQ